MHQLLPISLSTRKLSNDKIDSASTSLSPSLLPLHIVQAFYLNISKCLSLHLSIFNKTPSESLPECSHPKAQEQRFLISVNIVELLSPPSPTTKHIYFATDHKYNRHRDVTMELALPNTITLALTFIMQQHHSLRSKNNLCRKQFAFTHYHFKGSQELLQTLQETKA